MNQKLEKLIEDINRQNNILVLTGAGISTDSGIPDFRGINGIYTEYLEIPPETLLTDEFFKENTEKFYEFYNKFMFHPNAQPNSGHMWLKHLENSGKHVTIVTQNIDELHTKAGSSDVHEIHGSAFRFQCVYCHKNFHQDVQIPKWPKKNDTIPLCPFCKHILKPQVVLYGEVILLQPSEQLQELVDRCDLVLIMGTQLLVQPANTIPYMANGKVPIYIVNMTDYSDNESLNDIEYTLIQMKIGNFVKEIEHGNNLFDG